MGSKDQRAEGRVNVNWRTSVTRSNRTTIQGYVKNISWGGAQFESTILCNKGEVILMEITVPYKNTVHKLRIIAEVIYSILRQSGMQAMGIKFRKREPETEQFLRQFIGPSALAAQPITPAVAVEITTMETPAADTAASVEERDLPDEPLSAEAPTE